MGVTVCVTDGVTVSAGVWVFVTVVVGVGLRVGVGVTDAAGVIVCVTVGVTVGVVVGIGVNALGTTILVPSFLTIVVVIDPPFIFF